MFRTGTRNPEQAPSGSRLRSGDAAAQTQSQQGRGLSKSSEINGAWQIGATGSTEKVRQDGGLSEVMLNNGAHGQSQRKKSRKRKAKDSENESRIQKRMFSRNGHTELPEKFDWEEDFLERLGSPPEIFDWEEDFLERLGSPPEIFDGEEDFPERLGR